MINFILTDDVVANLVLTLSLNSLPAKYGGFCLLREEYQNNTEKVKATLKIKDRLQDIGTAENYLRSSVKEISGIKIQVVLGLYILTIDVQRD